MATQENRDTLYCRFIDSVVNHRRLDHLDHFLAGDVVEHAPARTAGLEAAQQTLATWLGRRSCLLRDIRSQHGRRRPAGTCSSPVRFWRWERLA